MKNNNTLAQILQKTSTLRARAFATTFALLVSGGLVAMAVCTDSKSPDPEDVNITFPQRCPETGACQGTCLERIRELKYLCNSTGGQDQFCGYETKDVKWKLYMGTCKTVSSTCSCTDKILVSNDDGTESITTCVCQACQAG